MSDPVSTDSEPLHPQPPTTLPEKPSRRGMSETLTRLLTAAVLIPSVVWVIVQGGLVYLAVVTAFVLLGQREFYHLIEEKGARPLWSLGLAAGAALQLVAYVGNAYHATLLMTASLLFLMVAQLRKRNITESLASISGTFFGVFYVGWLMSHAIVLRGFSEKAEQGILLPLKGIELKFLQLNPEAGIFFFIFTLAVVISSDAGAYFVGRAYGRHKLAPQISPSKTIEGAGGGVLCGIAAGLICKALFDQFWPSLSLSLEWAAVAAFGLVLALVGVVGDLVESLLKRDAKLKDTGALLPGMGGVLDRIDALLLAIPVMYYMLLGYFFVRLN
ncbi:MAG: phosphatidate cytidylyltransferase [Myxococcota bacterium]